MDRQQFEVCTCIGDSTDCECSFCGKFECLAHSALTFNEGLLYISCHNCCKVEISNKFRFKNWSDYSRTKTDIMWGLCYAQAYWEKNQTTDQ